MAEAAIANFFRGLATRVVDGTEILPIVGTTGEVEKISINSLLNCFGNIRFSGTGANLNPALTALKIPDFDTEISSSGVTASHTNNTLTINSPGTYRVYIQLDAQVFDNETYTVYLAKNDAAAGSIDLDIERKVGILEFITSGFLTGLIAGDNLSLYVASTNGGGASFIPTFLNLEISKVGT